MWLVLATFRFNAFNNVQQFNNIKYHISSWPVTLYAAQISTFFRSNPQLVGSLMRAVLVITMFQRALESSHNALCHRLDHFDPCRRHINGANLPCLLDAGRNNCNLDMHQALAGIYSCCIENRGSSPDTTLCMRQFGHTLFTSVSVRRSGHWI